jgi:dihydroorotase
MGRVIGELEDLRHIDFDRTVAVVRENRDVIFGIKIRVHEEAVGQNGSLCLRVAKEVSRTVDVPLMVHPGSLPSNLPLTDVLKVLEKGDIMTHCYPPPYSPSLPYATIFDENGNILPEVLRAKERGVLFDVGHGRNHFCWNTAEEALKQDFKPSTISTDLTTPSTQSVVFDLPTVLSKFLNLGLSLYDAIKCSTVAPASALGMEDSIGTLKVGTEADVAIFEIEEKDFSIFDNVRPVKEQRIIHRRLKPIKVIKGGREV